MTIELFKSEVLAIRARHRCPNKEWGEIFQFIQSIVHQLEGGPVTSEFKRALREELDRAYQGIDDTLKT